MMIKFGGNVNDRCGNLTKKKNRTQISWLRASPGGNSGNFLIKVVYGTEDLCTDLYFWTTYYLNVEFADKACRLLGVEYATLSR